MRRGVRTVIDPGSAPPCGWHCTDCPHLEKECPGCRPTGGKPFWTSGSGIAECAVYACCCGGSELEHCGLCPELPCGTFREWHDPSMSSDEVRESVKRRVAGLRERAAKRE
jgi:hypothetical protein